MVSIMEKAIYRIKMRTDNIILMVIMGDGIMGDLHFCLYMFLFFPNFLTSSMYYFYNQK